MNNTIKVLLSVLMVSLSVFFVEINEYNKDIKVNSITEQILGKSTNFITKNYVDKQTEYSNFEIDLATKEMNQELEKIEYISDIKEWFVAYKNLIYKYSYIIDPPETIYDYFSDYELDLLFRVVQAEVGDEYSFESKVNVVSVIFNRLECNKFKNTLCEVLLEKNQFQSILDGRYKEVKVSESTILACEYVFMFGNTADGALFFESGDKNFHEKYAKFLFEDEAGHKFYK